MFEQSLYFFDCCESSTLKKRKTPRGVGWGWGGLLLSGQSAKCERKKARKRTKHSKGLHYLDSTDEQKRSLEMWNLILNKKRSSHFKTSCLLCECLQHRFYLARHTNTFILSRTAFPVSTPLWKRSLGTHSVHMAVAVEGVFTQVDL